MKVNSKMNRFFSFMAYRNKPLLYMALFIPILFFGCETDSVEDTNDDVLSTQTAVHVAFAGGGWRAHTGHSAWIISLLDNKAGGAKTTLGDAFRNVSTISSNSGGSWFSTMLMYSKQFVKNIQSASAINAWNTNRGWLGQQRLHFHNATKFGVSCSDVLGSNPGKKEEKAYTACVFSSYTGDSATYWNRIVEDLIFKDDSLGDKKLTAPHQDWALNKSLLLASTLLCNQVVLNEADIDKRYYQACISPIKPMLNGDNGGSCERNNTPDVLPVTFSSMATRGKRHTAPPFLAGNVLIELGYTYNWGYASNEINSEALVSSDSIQNPLTNGNVPIILAAAASSAAGGFEASYATHDSPGAWQKAYEASDEALSFSLANSQVKFVDASGLSVKELADQKVVKLADGGPVDNSGVAQLVSFLQKTHQADGFNIVAFDNVQEVYSSDGSSNQVGIDIAYLFGEGLCPPSSGDQFKRFPSGNKCKCGEELCLKVPQLKVFEGSALGNPDFTWRVQVSRDSSNYQLIYNRYSVSTVGNLYFSVSAKSSGTLHAFTCVWPDAGTVPLKGDKSFDSYAKMLQFISSSLAKNNNEGLGYLKTAFGID